MISTIQMMTLLQQIQINHQVPKKPELLIIPQGDFPNDLYAFQLMVTMYHK